MEKIVLRNESIGRKVSDEEYAQLEKLAETRGLPLSEWLRELVLAELIAHPAEQIILTEILALRMLYLNTMQILGQKGGADDRATAEADRTGRPGETRQGARPSSREGRPARAEKLSPRGANLTEF